MFQLMAPTWLLLDVDPIEENNPFRSDTEIAVLVVLVSLLLIGLLVAVLRYQSLADKRLRVERLRAERLRLRTQAAVQAERKRREADLA